MAHYCEYDADVWHELLFGSTHGAAEHVAGMNVYGTLAGMDITQVEAFVSLIATGVPVVVTIVSGIFGFQSRRGADVSAPELTLTRFSRPPEQQPAQRRRLWYCRAETLFGLLIIPFAIAYSVSLLFALPVADTSGERLLFLLLAAFYLAITVFYTALLLPYLRMARVFFRRDPSQTFPVVHAEIMVDAALLVVFQQCQLALRRLRSTLQLVDIESGVVVARRHYFFNWYLPYFDEITMQVEQHGAAQCRLHIRSSGVMPTFLSDRWRNRRNIDRLIEYLTSG